MFSLTIFAYRMKTHDLPKQKGERKKLPRLI